MPELPEVETVARTLRVGGQHREAIIGRTVADVRLFWPRTLAEPSFEILAARLPGQTVQAVGRRAKFLIIELSLDTLLVHLRMSGDIRVEPAFDPDGLPLPPEP